MSFIQTIEVDVTTDASGNATVYTPNLTGYVSAIAYVKGSFSNGSTFLVTKERTGETLWSESNVNASAVRAPRQPTHSTTGAAALYASGGVAVNDRIGVGNERLKFVISGAGNVATGTFFVVMD